MVCIKGSIWQVGLEFQGLCGAWQRLHKDFVCTTITSDEMRLTCTDCSYPLCYATLLHQHHKSATGLFTSATISPAACARDQQAGSGLGWLPPECSEPVPKAMLSSPYSPKKRALRKSHYEEPS